MANDLGFEERFDPSEQSEILRQAIRLQEEQGSRTTATELERIALEAGIEPQFVRMAIARRKKKTIRKEGGVSGLIVLIPLLVFAQWYSVFQMLNPIPPQLSGAPSQHLWLTFGLAFLLGAMLPQNTKGRLAGLAAVTGIAIFCAALTGLWLRFIAGGVNPLWTEWLRNALLVELLLVFAGNAIKSATNTVVRLLRLAPAKS